MAWPSKCPDPSSIHEINIKIGQLQKVIFRWGDAKSFGTASYWISQYLIAFGQEKIPNQNIGSNLFEETLACLLGGYGVPSELGLAGFELLKKQGLTFRSAQVSAAELESILNEPMIVGNKRIRYRFPKQRANRIMDAFNYFNENPAPPNQPYALRNWLLKIKGIGLKTASWIVRNHTSSDDVAIIDIHIHRAGLIAGFFLEQWQVVRDYLLMEEAFLNFANAGCVPASGLDALIWSQMKILNNSKILGNSNRVRLSSKTGKGVPINTLFP
jgi:N-glycosylase/DNA lyase